MQSKEQLKVSFAFAEQELRRIEASLPMLSHAIQRDYKKLKELVLRLEAVSTRDVRQIQDLASIWCRISGCPVSMQPLFTVQVERDCMDQPLFLRLGEAFLSDIAGRWVGLTQVWQQIMSDFAITPGLYECRSLGSRSLIFRGCNVVSDEKDQSIRQRCANFLAELTRCHMLLCRDFNISEDVLFQFEERIFRLSRMLYILNDYQAIKESNYLHMDLAMLDIDRKYPDYLFAEVNVLLETARRGSWTHD